MSITPLSAARITGELGLAGGTITGGTYAAQYASKVVVVEKQKEAIVKDKEKAEQLAKDAVSERDLAVKHKGETSTTVHDTIMTQYLINDYFLKKHRSAVADINLPLQKLNYCLYGYLQVAEGDNCKEQRNEMKSKLQHFGVNFS